jgi:hypothetical protein
MTLDNDTWTEYFDSINVRSERLRAAVTLARVPLSPARAGRRQQLDARGGRLEAIRYNRPQDEIEVEIRSRADEGSSVRYFVPSPRSVTVEDSPLTKLICITDCAGLRTMVSIASFERELGAIGTRP